MERTTSFQYISRINIFNFYLNREVKSAETNKVDAEQCFAKKSQQSGNKYGRAVRS